MITSRYLRYPHVGGDLVTFIADDDVWLAPAAGGQAWRISADQAAVAYPRLSADSAQIVWTSWRDGIAEVYLAATGAGGAEAGGSGRVTYWSDRTTRVRGWGPGGQILATTAHGQHFYSDTWAYAIPVSGGAARFDRQRRLPFGPVSDIVIGQGSMALLTGSGDYEPAFWKRYRGGRAGQIWVASAAGLQPTSQFRRLLIDLPGQLCSPMLAGGRLVLISDHEGTANIYSCAIDGTDLRRHTDHDGDYARNASTDGTRVVYQLAGDIWMLPDLTADSEPHRLDITLGSPVSGVAPRLISAYDHLGSISVDRSGKASAAQVRGTVHWVTHRDGPARALSAIPGPPARLPVVLGGTDRVAWVVDDDGTDALEVASVHGTAAWPGLPSRRMGRGAIGWVSQLAAAPDGTVVAAAAMNGGLTIVDVGSGEVTELARSDDGPATGLAFSPDSRWLAWSAPVQGRLRRLMLADLAGRQVTEVTDGRFTDTDPVFTLDGKYLAFLSRRTFDPVHDTHMFDLYFPYGSRPYLLTLAASTPSPFGPFADGRPVSAVNEAGDHPGEGDGSREPASGQAEPARDDDGAPDQAPGKPAPLVIDLAGLGERIVTVPVPDSRYASLRAVAGGLAWLRVPLTGDLGEGGATLDDDEPRPALEYFDISRVKCTELAGAADEFEVSGDGTRLVVRDQQALRVVPANREADADNADDTVNVDLSRARYLAHPPALWRAAFAEAGRTIRHEYWIPDIADVDWDEVLDRYRPLLEKIATADDFTDLLLEVAGELGSSHAYVIGDGVSPRADHVAGLLGADLVPGDGVWRIARVLPHESSDPRARSPLAAPGVGVAAGDIIAAIDGQPVDQATGPGPLLVGTAGKPVELTVVRDGSTHRAVVVPLADERRLRYQAWVTGRRQVVRELGRGRLGYVHLPDMQSQGWSDFHRDLRSEMRKDALIVDVRANQGGHVSQLVVEKLARRIIGWDLGRNIQPVSYPEEAPRGPVIAIADEWSASDGDVVTAAIKTLRIGPVVGTRTWGGVIGFDSLHELVDGTRITVPKLSFWCTEQGWGVENYGVDPDIEVLITPDDWAAGRDTQLEAAVTLALGALAQHPAALPPTLDGRPSRRRQPLPPRPASAG